jgi:HEAT repeat protein/S1-C subfamily serine protease
MPSATEAKNGEKDGARATDPGPGQVPKAGNTTVTPAPAEVAAGRDGGEDPLYQDLLKSTVWILARQRQPITLRIGPKAPAGQGGGPGNTRQQGRFTAPGGGGGLVGGFPPSALGGFQSFGPKTSVSGDLTLTQWAGTQTLPGLDSLRFVFVGQGKVIMDDSTEILPGTYTQTAALFGKPASVTLTFFSGDITYTGTIKGQQMSGTAKNGTNTWNWNLTQENVGQAGKAAQVAFRTSTGMGGLVDRKHRLVLTNAGTVGDAESVTLYFPITERGERLVQRLAYKRRQGLTGRVVLKEERADLALIQLDRLPENVKPLALAKSSPRPAQPVHSVGSSSGALWVYSPGRVRQVFRDTWRDPVYGLGDAKFKTYDAMKVETDAPVNADSGGPLVDGRGTLVGVAHARDDAANKSAFIDVSEVQALLKRYYESVGEKWAPEPARPRSGPGPVPVAKLTEWVRKLEDEDFSKRVQAAQALGEMGEGACMAFGALFKALKDDNNLVRRAAGDALQKVPPHKDDVGMLTDVLKNAKEPAAVRTQASKALAKLGPAARPALPRLLDLLQESDEGLRQAALGAVAAVEPRPADVPALAGALPKASPEAARVLMEALAKLGGEAGAAAPALAQALKSADKATRVRAAHTLEAIGPPAKEAAPALTAALKDNEPQVARRAALALVKMGQGTAALPVLTAGVRTGKPEDRRGSIQALAQVGPLAASAAKELCNALDSDDTRADARAALVKIGRAAVKAIAYKLKHADDVKTRWVCIDAIKQIAGADRLTSEMVREVQSALATVYRLDQDQGNRDAALETSKLLLSRN